MHLDTTPLEIYSKDWRNSINLVHYRSILNSCRVHDLHEQYPQSPASLYDLACKGYCHLHPDNNLLAKIQSKSQYFLSLHQQHTSETSHLILDRIIDSDVIVDIINLLESLSIRKLASAYFGSPDITVSDFYYMWVKRYDSSLNHDIDGASLWHRDSMGRTLKVFLPLSSTGNSISTHLCTYSNTSSPIPQKWEMLRASPSLTYSQKVSLTNYISNHFAANFYQTPPHGQGIFIFDTNTFHRGAYMIHEGTPGDSRSHLQCTISYNPTLKLYSLLPGHGIEHLPNPVNLPLSNLVSPSWASTLTNMQFTFS